MNVVPCETLDGRVSYLHLPEVLDTNHLKGGEGGGPGRLRGSSSALLHMGAGNGTVTL